jgi:hypothetical protein
MRTIRLVHVALVLSLVAGSANAAEICGNAADDDNNGMTDEGCYPTMTTGVCESPLSCRDTGMVSWSTGSLHYELPPDISPRVPFGPGIGFRRFYTSQHAPGTNPTTVAKSPMGSRWQHTYLTYIYGFLNVAGAKRAVLHTSDGRDVLYSYSSTTSGWDTYTPQTGDHVLSLKQNTTTLEWRVQLLTGETLVYNSSGQISEIWDTLPTPNKVLIAWTSTSSGNVQSVMDANGKRRLWFTYTSGLLTKVTFQTKINFSWSNQHETTFSYTTGLLMSMTDGGQLAQQYTYTNGDLTNIADGAGIRITAFGYSVNQKWRTPSQTDRYVSRHRRLRVQLNAHIVQRQNGALFQQSEYDVVHDRHGLRHRRDVRRANGNWSNRHVFSSLALLDGGRVQRRERRDERNADRMRRYVEFVHGRMYGRDELLLLEPGLSDESPQHRRC